MNTKTKRIYDQIFQHPMTHNLEWREVRSLFESIGQVEEEHNGNQKLTMDGHTTTFHSPSDTDITTPEQINQLRHLLNLSADKPAEGAIGHLLVVLDHKEARIFHTEVKDSIPSHIQPFDSLGHRGHVHNSHVSPGTNDKPNYDAYFGQISKALHGAEQVLIFGSGQGSSSARDMFVAWLKKHHPKISELVMGAITIDESHMTDGQILSLAREIYSQP